MICEILSIGTELLMGQVANTDAQYISRRLSALGISVYHHTVVGDNVLRVKDALSTALSRSDIVITTGGLGPTEDDLTKETVAEYLSLSLVMHEESLLRIKKRIEGYGSVMTENNIKQAYIPETAIVMPNDCGTAPGCIIEKESKTVAILPGPPREMQDMFEKQLFPYLEKKSGETLVSRYLHIFGVGESLIETKLKDLFHLGTPTLALYCSTSETTARLSVMVKNEKDADAILDPVENEIRKRMGNALYAEGINETMPTTVLRMLKERNKRVSFAESCTGGMLASSLVDISGASDVFDMSFVTYSNEAKSRILGVDPGLLRAFGAVSPECARAMAIGAREKSQADYALSITGIAGPDGGTAEKPVGLVYIGIADKEGGYAHKFLFKGSRDQVRLSSVKHALNLLRLTLLNADDR
ncbi:MAG: competence/damage-inducible protein A [Clostridiales bacterium]|nr:competence/damage-inducible protein A [Clostridiales bacterium]